MKVILQKEAFAFALFPAFCLAGGCNLGGGFFLEEAALAPIGQLLLIEMEFLRNLRVSNLLILSKSVARELQGTSATRLNCYPTHDTEFDYVRVAKNR